MHEVFEWLLPWARRVRIVWLTVAMASLLSMRTETGRLPLEVHTYSSMNKLQTPQSRRDATKQPHMHQELITK